MAAMPADLITDLERRTGDLVETTRMLVEVESPTADLLACGRCAETTAELAGEWLGSPARVEPHDGRPVVRWGVDAPRVLLLGHVDTVWPLGTLSRLPWAVDGDRMTGPGVFDMKAGIAQGLGALAALGVGPEDGVGLLLTTDEETGSWASRRVIAESVAAAEAVLVLEPSVDGALKTTRKGTSWYTLTVLGRAAHAGLDPENGVNALVLAAGLIHDLVGTADPAVGTTVTPTTASAGTTSNTVPSEAQVTLDVRAWTAAEQERVDAAVRGWRPPDPRARYDVAGGIDRPAMEDVASRALFERAVAGAGRLGLPAPEGRAVGGASDGNLTAAAGVPTLDGLGPVGEGAHADHEWASVAAMPLRAALVAALVRDLIDAPAVR
jgi:glutamate carboxypeptidase